MADENVDPASQPQELESRAPNEDDLAALCRRLNDLDAKYVVVGGFAIRQARSRRRSVSRARRGW